MGASFLRVMVASTVTRFPRPLSQNHCHLLVPRTTYARVFNTPNTGHCYHPQTQVFCRCSRNEGYCFFLSPVIQCLGRFRGVRRGFCVRGAGALNAFWVRACCPSLPLLRIFTPLHLPVCHTFIFSLSGSGPRPLQQDRINCLLDDDDLLRASHITVTSPPLYAPVGSTKPPEIPRRPL